jgi:tagatose kinase
MADILTFGEALVEIMRTAVGQPLDQPGPFTGPYPSGAPFIFAAQAARLGAQVTAVGCVGEDAFGQCLLDQLQRDQINTRGIVISPTYATGVAFVAYDPDGSRDFVFHIAQAAAGQLHPDMLDEALFAGLKCLHLMGSTLSIHEDALATGWRALELAQTAGAKISFDPNIRPELLPPEQAADVFQPFLQAADVFIPTAAEAQLLTGQDSLDAAIEHLLAAKPERVIVVTQGAEGCTVYTQAKKQHVPGFPAEEVDPTGAGDCFDAGFLVSWLSGQPLADAARFANACGALAVTQQGPMTGAQPLDKVQAFIAANT